MVTCIALPWICTKAQVGYIENLIYLLKVVYESFFSTNIHWKEKKLWRGLLPRPFINTDLDFFFYPNNKDILLSLENSSSNHESHWHKMRTQVAQFRNLVQRKIKNRSCHYRRFSKNASLLAVMLIPCLRYYALPRTRMQTRKFKMDIRIPDLHICFGSVN